MFFRRKKIKKVSENTLCILTPEEVKIQQKSKEELEKEECIAEYTKFHNDKRVQFFIKCLMQKVSEGYCQYARYEYDCDQEVKDACYYWSDKFLNNEIAKKPFQKLLDHGWDVEYTFFHEDAYNNPVIGIIEIKPKRKDVAEFIIGNSYECGY